MRRCHANPLPEIPSCSFCAIQIPVRRIQYRNQQLISYFRVVATSSAYTGQDFPSGPAVDARRGCATVPSMPLLSIVLPVHGVAGYLRECLDSILSQTFADFEIV